MSRKDIVPPDIDVPCTLGPGYTKRSEREAVSPWRLGHDGRWERVVITFGKSFIVLKTVRVAEVFRHKPRIPGARGAWLWWTRDADGTAVDRKTAQARADAALVAQDRPIRLRYRSATSGSPI